MPEDRHAVGCITGMSVAENIFLNRLDAFTRYGFLRRRRVNSTARELMQRFDVRAAGPEIAFSSLSGGNQQKAVLARELTLENLAVLVAAQPTRGLDVGAVEAVYGHIRAACARGVGVLLISSELDELLDVAHRVIVLYRGRIMGTCAADRARARKDRRHDGGPRHGRVIRRSLAEPRRSFAMTAETTLAPAPRAGFRWSLLVPVGAVAAAALIGICSSRSAGPRSAMR